MNLGLVDITLQRYPDAEKALRKAIEVNRNFLWHTLILPISIACKSKCRWPRVLQQGVANNPDSSPLYFLWAEILTRRRRPPRTEAVLQKVEGLKGNSPEVATALGNFYAGTKQNPSVRCRSISAPSPPTTKMRS